MELDVEDYRRGIKELQHSVVLRLVLKKGEVPSTNMTLKENLEIVWGFNQFKVITLREEHITFC